MVSSSCRRAGNLELRRIEQRDGEPGIAADSRRNVPHTADRADKVINTSADVLVHSRSATKIIAANRWRFFVSMRAAVGWVERPEGRDTHRCSHRAER